MNGAASLLHALTQAGVDTCFTNPGTSEMHFVAALDREENMRCILGLFEGVVTGAADGYARMAGKPACTLLHLGPGLANGLANLHNARRAHSPIINLIGEHATYHRKLDAPLTSDIHGFASPVSHWIHTVEHADALSQAGVDAVVAASTYPGQIASLILPADTAWSETETTAAPQLPPAPAIGADEQIRAAAIALKSGEPCAIILNGNATQEEGLKLASQIGNHTGAKLLGDTFLARISRGAGRVALERLPYFAEQAAETLSAFKHLILVSSKAPVSFFAYPNIPSELAAPETEIHTLCASKEDPIGSLRALIDELGAKDAQPVFNDLAIPTPGRGELTLGTLAQSIGAYVPENCVIVSEAATSGIAIPSHTECAQPHEWLELTGGAIGIGIPMAVGAAVACPDRKIFNLQADGSAMYTLQGLWTQAREKLNVLTVIFANRKYAILQVELMRVGAENPGPKAFDMLDLSRPNLEWVDLANGMGVEAIQVATIEDFNRALAVGIETQGPYLIEVLI